MKPVVGSAAAWFCTILSVFAVVILSVIALLFKSNHESMVGSINDPEDGAAVAKTVFGAVVVYLLFFVFCGSQIYANKAQSRVRLKEEKTVLGLLGGQAGEQAGEQMGEQMGRGMSGDSGSYFIAGELHAASAGLV